MSLPASALVLAALAQAAPRGAGPGGAPAVGAPRAADAGAGRPAAGRASAATGSSAAADLLRLEERVGREVLGRRPWIAVQRGAAGAELGLGELSDERDLREDVLLLELRAELLAVDPRPLAPLDQAHLDHLRDWVDGQIILDQARTSGRRDPVVYVSRLEACLHLLLDDAGEDEPFDVAAAERLVERVPALWAFATNELLSPRAEVSAEAVARLREVERRLRTELEPELLQAAGEARRLELGDLVERALGATAAFRDWLAASPARTAASSSKMGVLNWELLFEKELGTDVDARTLEARLLRELVRLGRRGSGAAHPPSPDSPPDPAALEATALRGSEEALAVLAGAGCLVPETDWSARFRVRTAPAGSVPGPVGRLRTTAAGLQVLELETPAPEASLELERDRLARLADPDLRVLAACLGPPGEALLRVRGESEPSPARRFLWSRPARDGWGLYVADLELRLPAESTDPALTDALLRARTLEITRLLASIELHAEGLPFDEAAQAFARRSGLGDETARFETLAVLHDPLAGSGYLGLSELRALEQAVGGEDEVERVRRVCELVLAHPTLRPSDLRRHLLN